MFSPSARYLLIALAVGLPAILGVVNLAVDADHYAQMTQPDPRGYFNNSLQQAALLSKVGRHQEARGYLQRCQPMIDTTRQRRRWMVAMAEIHAGEMTGSEGLLRQRKYERGRRYYEAALALCETAGQERHIHMRLAQLAINNQLWQEARAAYAQLDMAELEPAERWQALLDQAQIQVLAGDSAAALELIAEVERDAPDDFRVPAAFERGRLLLQQLPPPGPEREACLQDLTELYAGMTRQFRPPRATYYQALLGLARLAAIEDKHDTVTAIVREIQVSGAQGRIKLDAFEILADHPKITALPVDADLAIDLCLRRYPGSLQAGQVILKLMRQRIGALPPQVTLERMRVLLSRFPIPALTADALALLIDPQGGFPEKLGATAEPEQLAMLSAMLQDVRTHRGSRWQPIVHYSFYVQAVLDRRTGNLPQSASALSRYLAGEPAPELLADAYYLDLANAVALEANPAVQVLRALRFIRAYPGDARVPRALHVMVDAQSRMQDFAGAMQTAQNAFLKNIWDASEQLGLQSSDESLATITRITRAYVQLAEYDKADLLFRMYAPLLKQTPMGATFHADCAHAAAQLGQLHEAVRRYDTALEHELTPLAAMEIQVSRLSTALAINQPKAITAAAELSQALIADQHLKPAPRQALLRQLSEARLVHALSHDPDRVEEILRALPDELSSGAWYAEWVLRLLEARSAGLGLLQWRELHADLQRTTVPAPGGEQDTHAFLSRQIALLDRLIHVEERTQTLQKRGLAR